MVTPLRIAWVNWEYRNKPNLTKGFMLVTNGMVLSAVTAARLQGVTLLNALANIKLPQ